MQNNIPSDNTGKPAETSVKGLLPIFLLALSLVIWFSFQMVQTIKTRDGLINAFTSQEPQIQASNKIKATLSAVATSTKLLANQGNPNAVQIVNALAQRGINIADPNAPQQSGK